MRSDVGVAIGAVEQQPKIAERRAVTGRYLIRVEALEWSGEARGQVVGTLAAPSAEELARVAAGRPDRMPQTPETLSFIGALPGELVEVEVSWLLPRPARRPAKRIPPPTVRLVVVREASPDRVTPACNVFGVCGGCQLQHLAYRKQLEWKTERVRATLGAAGFAEPPVRPAIGCEPPWRYRNHMRFSVDREGRVGLTARGTHRVLPLAECPIAHPLIGRTLELLAHEPQPRPQVLVRVGTATRQMLLQPAPVPAIAEQLTAQGVTLRQDGLEEELLGTAFRIRPSSFFQTNTAQANRMAELVIERLPCGPEVTLVDAYCGVGTFARLLARRAGRVLAIEESASAVRDARQNLDAAGNVEVVQGKVEDVLPELAERLDGLVIDPPRAGVQRPVLNALVRRRVPRVVYVSCDPDTLARDLAYLCNEAQAYRLAEVQPLDMFPQTAHVENVATLEAL